ncbi:cation transporter [Isoptericola sp. S6320L]|uniref:cation diffusion facilitator family transporter n=1 Tax=Isoptericola sp. S6320L TaxID=2926411 RepID=UPI001FF5F48D|nr:cation transporter [Isoptericola sp. S6320L]MCK0116694.1 cation transporter [Isoptericola sp. S6320L]
MSATATPTTTALTRRGLRLARLTIAYNVVEGVVAIGAGVATGLVSVIGFGIDSGIETAAAVLVAMRLAARLRRGAAGRDSAGAGEPDPSEPDPAELRREHRTLRAVAATFFLLAAWVTAEGIRALVTGAVPETSPLALGVLVASLVIMPVLAAAKYRVGRALGDPLVLADAAETRVCVWLSVATLAGLLAFWWTGQAWFDPLAGFVVAAFAVHEGLEAWEGELVEDHD